MAKFVIERIGDGEIAWSWRYEDGLTLDIKKNPYTKNEILDILKNLKNKPSYEFSKDKKIMTFYAHNENQPIAEWNAENNPVEKILNEFNKAKITYQNPEDDPNNTDKDMQNNMGTGESGS